MVALIATLFLVGLTASLAFPDAPLMAPTAGIVFVIGILIWLGGHNGNDRGRHG